MIRNFRQTSHKRIECDGMDMFERGINDRLKGALKCKVVGIRGRKRQKMTIRM